MKRRLNIVIIEMLFVFGAMVLIYSRMRQPMAEARDETQSQVVDGREAQGQGQQGFAELNSQQQDIVGLTQPRRVRLA